jgi:hypothetical protein
MEASLDKRHVQFWRDLCTVGRNSEICLLCQSRRAESELHNYQWRKSGVWLNNHGWCDGKETSVTVRIRSAM